MLVQPPPPPSPRPAESSYIHYQYPPLPPTDSASPGYSRPAPYVQSQTQFAPSQYTPNQYAPTQPQQNFIQHTPHVQSPSSPATAMSSTAIAPPQPAPFQQWPLPPTHPSYLHPSTSSAVPMSSGVANTPSMASSSMPISTPNWNAANSAPSQPDRPLERKVIVAKQYVIHELGQTDKTPRPKWNSTMTAMFGNHADWENLRVYTTKGRPFSQFCARSCRLDLLISFLPARPTQICPITGKVAKYLDPRTNVPYADLSAYRVLSAILRHEHVWSPRLGCYVSREGSVFAESGP